MKVLIVEDEPFAQQELKRLLSASGYAIEIAGCTDSIEETIDWLKNNRLPDLIFLDIQLSDGLSFEIFRHNKIMCPVIFTTAYDEYSIRAFRLNSIDYLLKPVKPEELKAALDKFEDIRKTYSQGTQSAIDFSRLEQLLKPALSDYKTRFLVRIGDQIKHIDVQDIAWFLAEENVVFLTTKSNHRYIIEYTLDQIATLVDPRFFTRINRSYIAHISSIAKVSRHFNGRLLTELTPAAAEPVYVSRARVKDFIDWLDR